MQTAVEAAQPCPALPRTQYFRQLVSCGVLPTSLCSHPACRTPLLNVFTIAAVSAAERWPLGGCLPVAPMISC